MGSSSQDIASSSDASWLASQGRDLRSAYGIPQSMHMTPTQGLTVGVRLPAKLALLIDSLKHIEVVEYEMVMPPLEVVRMFISGMHRMQLNLGKNVYSRHVIAFIHSTPAANSDIEVLPDVENLVRVQVHGDPRLAGTVWDGPSECNESLKDTGAVGNGCA